MPVSIFNNKTRNKISVNFKFYKNVYNFSSFRGEKWGRKERGFDLSIDSKHSIRSTISSRRSKSIEQNVLLSITISINFQPPSDRTNDRPTIRNREVSAQKRSRKRKKGREGVGYSKKSTSRFDPPLCSRLFNPIRALLFPFVRGHRINDSHAYDSVNL